MQSPPAMGAAVEEESLVLPPGFRFHPTDEEIVTHYLSPKIHSHGAFCARAVGEVDLNKCEPWDLRSKAKMGEKDLYFFCQRDRKYPTGMRTNRATQSGYWKATGKDKEIFRGRVLVGMKKTLVFYTGRAPKGEKTNWVMHEYRLEGKAPLSLTLPRSAKDEWVVCRVFHKDTILSRRSPMHGNGLARVNSFTDELLESPTLPPLLDTAYFANPRTGGDDCFQLREAMTESCDLVNSVYQNKSPFASNPPPPPSLNYFQQIIHASGYPYLDMDCYLPPETPLQPPAIRRHCKAEQYSSPSMLSQDTGVSTEPNVEFSSVISKHERGSCHSYDEDLDATGATGSGELDLSSMWKC